jgi:hypothetical protein
MGHQHFEETAMSMKVGSTPPVGAPVTPAEDLPETKLGSGPMGPGNPEFDKVFNKVAMNVLQGGDGMLREAMQKFFEDDEEPDEDDPDAESL